MSEMRILSPGRRWHVLAGLVASIEAKHVVEVGCKEGQTTAFLLKEFPDLRVTAIDPWCVLDNDAESYADWDFRKIEFDFWQNVGATDYGRHKPANVRMLRMTSLEAAESHFDEAADIVFIDAAHDEANVLADIKAWWPHVRTGGYLCGHDYQHAFPGVHRAVAKCFPLLRVSIMPDSVWCVQKDASLRLAA